MASIWKDYLINLGTDESTLYRIKVGGSSGEIIYSGRSYLRPGETDNIIRINDICADYLTNVVPGLTQAEFTELTFPLAFVVEAYIGGSWVNKDTVSFINDWSYDDDYDPITMGMAFPITGHIDARQWLFYTAYSAESVTAILHFKNGTTQSVIIPIAISSDFNDDFNDDFAKGLRAAGSGTASIDLSQWDDIVRVDINGQSYDVVTDCGEWVLYYTNAFGGWDSLLIEGATTERETLSRQMIETEYDNRVSRSRGKRNFVNIIEKVYTLHSGWMNDDESERMHHLMNSTDVYLCNIGTGKMYPVVINNAENPVKKFKTEGRQMVSYDIEVSLAQDRMRR